MYSAYDVHPLDAADEWGDVASFPSAGGASLTRFRRVR
jgi:hypothetical protein